MRLVGKFPGGIRDPFPLPQAKQGSSESRLTLDYGGLDIRRGVRTAHLLYSVQSVNLGRDASKGSA